MILPQARIKADRTHPLYATWNSMFGRAYYKTNPFYKDYGARGIKVCKAWFNFITFITDMGSKPTEEHTLDRINVNGNYTPANTRWSSRVEQANNKRRKYRC